MKLLDFLQKSAATPEFVAAVGHFLSTGSANDRILFAAGSPPVKIERTLTKVLEELCDLPIESVQITGRSGCEYFRGELTVRTADDIRHIDFDWNCRWRADEQGWTDYFGLPDQIRAAREFGYDCFRGWEGRHTPASAAA
ncbi:MAG TPA: hypothetical protein VMN39_08245 [Longimicrobiaceae bacterium]|nr:hypothetical protein [Longimicrobiaceae bacterium]